MLGSSPRHPDMKKAPNGELYNSNGGPSGTPAFLWNAEPSLAGSVGRIPTNVPLARLLNGIPPHRFESPLYGMKKAPDRGA